MDYQILELYPRQLVVDFDYFDYHYLNLDYYSDFHFRCLNLGYSKNHHLLGHHADHHLRESLLEAQFTWEVLEMVKTNTVR